MKTMVKSGTAILVITLVLGTAAQAQSEAPMAPTGPMAQPGADQGTFERPGEPPQFASQCAPSPKAMHGRHRDMPPRPGTGQFDRGPQGFGQMGHGMRQGCNDMHPGMPAGFGPVQPGMPGDSAFMQHPMPGGFGPMGQGMGAGFGPAPFDMPARNAPDFSKLDANGDGMLTQDEFDAARFAPFTEMDTDGDGLISTDELAAKRTEPIARMIKAQSAAFVILHDLDGDGMLSSEEMQPGRERGGLIERLDGDGDGTVSKEEFEAARPQLPPPGGPQRESR